MKKQSKKMALYTPKEEPLPKHCEYSCVCHKSSMDIGVFGWDTGSDKKGGFEVSIKIVVAWPISEKKKRMYC